MQFFDNTKENTHIIATGGNAQLIAQKSKYIQGYDFDMTLDGMKAIYDMTVNARNEKK